MERLGDSMAIFREFQKYGRDRSAEDRRRHRELVEKSIKENIGILFRKKALLVKLKIRKSKSPSEDLKNIILSMAQIKKLSVQGMEVKKKETAIPKENTAMETAREIKQGMKKEKTFTKRK